MTEKGEGLLIHGGAASTVGSHASDSVAIVDDDIPRETFSIASHQGERYYVTAVFV